MVVTPLRKEKASGSTLSAFFAPQRAYTWTWISIRPGVTYRSFKLTTLRASDAGMSAATRAILPPAMATSITRLMLFCGSMTWPLFSRRS